MIETVASADMLIDEVMRVKKNHLLQIVILPPVTNRPIPGPLAIPSKERICSFTKKARWYQVSIRLVSPPVSATNRMGKPFVGIL